MIPEHVAIIMDGNGRWAKMRGKERVFGHHEGTESVRACTEYAVEKGIRYLSFFAFSEENWSRPDAEVSELMHLMAVSILNERPVFKKNNIRFVVIGNRSRLSEALNEDIDEAMEETSANTGLTLIVFLSYSGKWDIEQAAGRFAASGAPEGHFSDYLATAGIPDPDLLIRTSGEQRISNFMLWQCAYTEFYFTPVLWPDFRKTEFQKALDEYSSRSRRFGKTGDQVTIEKKNDAE
ncbi:MAG TPA: di-trans,poly-cis-decaprenylcistransferase [Candidatus Coprenecus stercoravium]|uniref:Isoprenyl transferase n=1 Tax=Candidatus Coprenecus stercoravium TaxID=2840735 RepID=A0A9D2GQ10_9BACT|nr:di-trans,poly-cis-decaprenylcistransferase [Candidatus Coprenecus stercoravium]